MPFDPLTLIPGAGSIASAFLQRHWALKDWHRTNEYNAPKNQVKRLQEAGLPLAAMFSGSGGSTASPVQQTNVDPTLGTAKGLETYFQNRLQQKQLKLLDEQIRIEAAKADREEGTNEFLFEKTMEGPFSMDTEMLPGQSNQRAGLVRERQIQAADVQFKGFQNQMEDIKSQVMEELNRLGKLTEETVQRIKGIAQHNANMEQDYRQKENWIKFQTQVSEDMFQGGTGWAGIMRLLRALFYKQLIGK